jgi:hypothetical protein
MKTVHPRGKVEGQWLCRLCRKPCLGRRSSWCSDACRIEGVALLFFVHSARSAVFHRDKGICADCGLDTEKLRKDLETEMVACQRPWGIESKEAFEERAVRLGRLRARTTDLEARGFSKCFRDEWHSIRLLASLWEADHITPRVLGGEHALENMRTLCCPCHKAATKRLAKFRAHNRRLRIPKPKEAFS